MAPQDPHVPNITRGGRLAGLRFKRKVRDDQVQASSAPGLPEDGPSSAQPPAAATTMATSSQAARTSRAASPSHSAIHDAPPQAFDEPSAPSVPPCPLRVTQVGPPPAICEASEGKVAAQGTFTTMVLTSPNADYVPEYPVERGVVRMYANGRWGLREYSRWPQMLIDEMLHVACIPREPTVECDEVLWEELSSETCWEEDLDIGISGIGFIAPRLRTPLVREAIHWLVSFRACALIQTPGCEAYLKHGHRTAMVLEQALDRMRSVPTTPGLAIAVASHVQRLSLELAGLITYLKVVHPRIRSTEDYSSSLLPVLGTFVRDRKSAELCRRVGLPTWFLQPLTPTLRVWRIVDVEKLPVSMGGVSTDTLADQVPTVAAVANLTGQWLRDMQLVVSKLLCGTHMPPLLAADATIPLGAHGQPHPAKRVRTEAGESQTKHFQMKPIQEEKKQKDRNQRLVAESGSGPTAGAESGSAGGTDGSAALRIQPAKTFVRSPFYSVPDHWAQALVPTVAAVANLTGQWLRDMQLVVSKLLCGTHMPPLQAADATIPLGAHGQPHPAKRVRTEAGESQTKHFQMKPIQEEKKQKDRNQRLVADSGSGPTAGTESGSAGRTDSTAALRIQPAKTFVRSPFYSVPDHWAQALVRVSPVPTTPASALYFYPPPFLLDTISPQCPLPPDAVHPDAARTDYKVLRYIHNFLRIRRFCRARLFDPSMSSHPLSISEWRTALWGDYSGKGKAPKGTNGAEIRRAKRRVEEWNTICRLFGRVAIFPSYGEDMIVNVAGQRLGVKDIATHASLRMQVLWEAHEINFRCEVMALDAFLLQSAHWNEYVQWERESAVAAIWEGTSVLSVLPPDDFSGAVDRWSSGTGADWQRCRDFLVRFMRMMTRWPDFPATLRKDLDNAHAWDTRTYDFVSRAAVDFYVETFVRTYKRLPTPPISPLFV
ncbi:hypothetical protein OH77DRAFT_1524434 [Trametes cingulata]|nr:hypothetical protein OH77DRAFT_1524434 [Trametes cingulata]